MTSSGNTGRIIKRQRDHRLEDMIQNPKQYFEQARIEARRQIERELEQARHRDERASA